MGSVDADAIAVTDVAHLAFACGVSAGGFGRLVVVDATSQPVAGVRGGAFASFAVSAASSWSDEGGLVADRGFAGAECVLDAFVDRESALLLG